MELCVLGRIAVVTDGRERVLGSGREAALLADLIVHAGQMMPAERLIEDLWNGAPPPGAAGTLQTYVRNLRRVLEPDRAAGSPSRVLLSRRPGYVLEIDDDVLDARRFERLVIAGGLEATGDPAGASATLREALALWKGPAFGELANEPYLRADATRLEELRLSALEGRIDADLGLGRHQDVCGELGPLATAHPYRERLWGQLMLALYRSGRQADALRAYHRLRAALAEELGLEPSASLRDLDAAIVLQKPELDHVSAKAAAALLRAEPERRRTVAVSPTPLLGRDELLATVADSIRPRRVVTLTGPGGIGKSRLALAVAADVSGRFEDGVRVVELARVTDAVSVPGAVAEVLGVVGPPGAASMSAVAEHLIDRHVLVVIDNCEHVIDGAADLVGAVLRISQTAAVVATSRESLDVDGEIAIAVPGLASGGEDSAAVQLFVERARRARYDFAPVESDLDAIDDICRTLDGMPLAIELAAARVRSMTVEEIRQRLASVLALLRGHRSGVPDRRTLDGAIDWSYRQLVPSEQLAFEGLSVFARGAMLTAAEDVLADSGHVAVALDGLVRKSLLEASLDRGRTRYRLLEPLRQFARERLEDRDEHAPGEVRRRHAHHYVKLAATARRQQSTPEGPDAIAEFAAEWDNITVALDWLTSHDDIDGALNLVRSCFWYAETTFHFDLLTLAERAIALPGAHDHEDWPAAAGATSILRRGIGDPTGARALADTALAAAESRAHHCFEALYAVHVTHQRFDQARAEQTVISLEEAFGASPDPIERAGTQYCRAVFDRNNSRPGQQDRARRAVTDAESSQVPHHLALAYTALLASTPANEWASAVDAFERARHHATVAGSRMIRKNQHIWMADAASTRGGRDALGYATEAIQGSYDDGYWGNFDVGLGCILGPLVELGGAHVAGTLLGGLIRMAGDDPPTLRVVNSARHALENALGDELDHVIRRGAAASNRELARLALDEAARLLT